MSERIEALAAFVRAGMRLPFIWGQRDCCLWVCDWIVKQRGVDPAAALRGAYASEAECAALVAARGWLPALVDELAAAAGLSVTDAPLAGDMALVETKAGPALMLVTGIDADSKLFVAWKSKGGLVLAEKQTALKAWTI